MPTATKNTAKSQTEHSTTKEVFGWIWWGATFAASAYNAVEPSQQIIVAGQYIGPLTKDIPFVGWYLQKGIWVGTNGLAAYVNPIHTATSWGIWAGSQFASRFAMEALEQSDLVTLSDEQKEMVHTAIATAADLAFTAQAAKNLEIRIKGPTTSTASSQGGNVSSSAENVVAPIPAPTATVAVPVATQASLSSFTQSMQTLEAYRQQLRASVSQYDVAFKIASVGTKIVKHEDALMLGYGAIRMANAAIKEFNRLNDPFVAMGKIKALDERLMKDVPAFVKMNKKSFELSPSTVSLLKDRMTLAFAPMPTTLVKRATPAAT